MKKKKKNVRETLKLPQELCYCLRFFSASRGVFKVLGGKKELLN